MDDTLRGLQLAAVLCLVLAGALRPQPQTRHDLEDATKPISLRASEIRQYAASRFPDSFTGVAVDDGQSMVIVYRVPSQAFDAGIRQRFPNVSLVLANATMSASSLSALSTLITDDMADWRNRGVRITMVGPDPARSAVRIGVYGDFQSARRRLEDHYGEDHIYVVYAAPSVPA